MRNIDDLPEERRVELARIGAPLGLSGQQVLAASELNMSPERYAALKDCRSVTEMRSSMDQLAARERARKDAEHELAVEKEKTKLRSGS